MRRLLVLAAVTALAVARPETYREKEDFKYSRSSSDDGSKSGYYGAQRGNMGGNYERAHNMDSLAQNQMSGLVRQTQGELGDGATQRSGSVYTAANSRGTYGSGHFDLSNLEGRNFQEGGSHGDSQSHSSMSSQSNGYGGQHHSSYSQGGYDSSNAYNSRYRGYNTAGNSDQMLYANVQQHNADDLQAANQESHSSGYQSKYGYSSQSGYNQASLDSADRYGSNAQHSHRLVGVSAIPVRVVLRPGTRIAVPVAAETYDASHGASTYDATHHGSSTFDQNAINTEAESLSGNDQHVAYQPTNNGKHFESSYSYRKEWEKHHGQPGSVPTVIPTINPYPQNSELYEDAQAHNTEQQEARGSESHTSHSSHKGYVKSGTSQQSSHQADYNSQQHSSASNADSSAYTLQHNNGAALSQVLNNQVENLNPTPKSYQSSYSYHKSWERQGDPYVIKPVSTSDDASQRLTAGSSHHGAYTDSHQYGSQHRYGSQRKTYLNNGYEDCDCDENGHIRVARSYNSYPDHQQQEDLTQQTQQQWDRLEDLGQQTQNKWDKYEDLGQHTQNQDLTQQSQNRWEKIEDLEQQTQNQWGNQQQTVSHSNWDKLELERQSQNTEQQTQNKWSTFETMKNEHNKHDDQKSSDYENTNPINTFNVGFNQNTENINSDNNFELQKQHNDASVLGHNFQTSWDENENQKQDKNMHDLGQQTQDQWDMFHSAFNTNQDEFKPIWQHSTNSYHTSYSYDKPYFNNGQSNNAGMNNEGQVFNNMYAQNGHHHNWQSHYMSTPEQSWTVHSNTNPNDKTHTSDSSLTSLWDKLDNIEKQSAASLGSEEVNDHSTNQHVDQTHASTDFEHTYNHNKYFNTYNKEEDHKVSLDDKVVSAKVTSTTTEKAKASGKSDNHEILRPQDIGRGDIGPEDAITTTEKTILYVRPLQPTTRPHKTAEELEVLSLSKESEKITTSTQKTTTSTQTNQHTSRHQNDFKELSVLNLDTTKQTETHKFENSKYEIFNINGTTTPNSVLVQNTREQNKQSQSEDEQYFTEFGQQHENVGTLGQELVDFGQHENGGVNFEQQSQNADAQYGQQSNNFDQQNNGFYQKSLNNNKPENFMNQQSEQFEQELVPLQIEELSQHNKRENDEKHWKLNHEKNDQDKNLEQQTGNFEHDNLEQQTQNFEQQTGNFERVNLEQQPQNFEQQNGNFEQQTQSFEQQTGNFEHENLEPQNFEQQTGNFEHDNLEQQTQNFEQQIRNFEHEHLEQQPQSFEQQTQNFEQQTGNFEHENLEQQPQNFEQQTGNFEHDNLEQQTQNFEQQTGNLKHENLEQQPQNFEQQTGNFDHANLEQQTQNFEQQTGNFEQQTGNFEHHNLEQQTQNLQQQTGNFAHEKQSEGKPDEDLQKPDVDKFTHHTIPERIDQSNIDIEPPIVSKNVTEVGTLVETVNEETGFWKSVGSKFVNAKDKVASWFKS